MIRKRDLLLAIDHNTEQIVWQGQLITNLKKRIDILEGKSKQPRTKDGKFAKKK